MKQESIVLEYDRYDIQTFLTSMVLYPMGRMEMVPLSGLFLDGVEGMNKVPGRVFGARLIGSL